MTNTKKHSLDFLSVCFAVSYSSGYGQNIEQYAKASNSGEFTAADVNCCRITLEHVNCILTSLRDEKLKGERM